MGLANRQWLPIHVEDSWDPDDDMRLMKCAFGHQFMITDEWGKSHQRHLQGIRKGWQEARPAAWRKLKRSSCRNIKAGARAHGAEATEEHGGPGMQEPGPKCRKPGEGGCQEAVTPEGKNYLCSWAEGRPRTSTWPRRTPHDPPNAQGRPAHGSACQSCWVPRPRSRPGEISRIQGTGRRCLQCTASRHNPSSRSCAVWTAGRGR
jgi:hypothetical protein